MEVSYCCTFRLEKHRSHYRSFRSVNQVGIIIVHYRGSREMIPVPWGCAFWRVHLAPGWSN